MDCKINCLIANSPMKMQGDDNFANRVVVRFVEGDVVYNLTSVKFDPELTGSPLVISPLSPLGIVCENSLLSTNFFSNTACVKFVKR